MAESVQPETVLRALKEAVKSRRSEQGERAAVQTVLAKYGSHKLPQLRQGKTPEGATIRIYIWTGTPAGDFALCTGPSLEGEIRTLESMETATASPGAAYIEAGEAPPRTVSQIRDELKKRGARESTILPELARFRMPRSEGPGRPRVVLYGGARGNPAQVYGDDPDFGEVVEMEGPMPGTEGMTFEGSREWQDWRAEEDRNQAIQAEEERVAAARPAADEAATRARAAYSDALADGDLVKARRLLETWSGIVDQYPVHTYPGGTFRRDEWKSHVGWAREALAREEREAEEREAAEREARAERVRVESENLARTLFARLDGEIKLVDTFAEEGKLLDAEGHYTKATELLHSARSQYSKHPELAKMEAWYKRAEKGLQDLRSELRESGRRAGLTTPPAPAPATVSEDVHRSRIKDAMLAAIQAAAAQGLLKK